MPQPLSRVKNITVDDDTHRLTFGSLGVIDKRPRLAFLLAQAIATWSNAESFFLGMFTMMLGSNRSLAARIYLAQETETAKSAAFSAVVDAMRDPRAKQGFSALHAILKSQRKIRAKLAHHVWGIHPELPEALLLTDPVNLILEYDPSVVFVYREKDLNDIAQGFNRVCALCLVAKDYFKPDADDDSGRNAALDLLLSQPEIAEKVRHQAQPSQTSQEAHPSPSGSSQE